MADRNPLSQIEQILLDLLANNLFGCGRSVSVRADEWDYIWKEAYIQAVSLTAFADGISKDIHDDTAAHIKNKIGDIVLSVARRIGEHTFIHRLLTEAQIPYTIIKGFACSLYYNDPLLRLIGDVDFLVNPEDEQRTVQLLTDRGFTEMKTTGESHRVFYYKGCRYELHTEPAGIPAGEMGEVIKEYLNDVVEESRVCSSSFGQVNVPDEFHHGLIMLLHMSHHLGGEGIGLRHLCDWAVFVSSMGEQEFISLFREPLEKMGLWHFACVLTEACVNYLGCDISFSQLDCKEMAEALLVDLFEGGNLGQKNDNRAHEALVLSLEKTSNSYLKNLFESANRIVYKNWGISRRIKIILPFGWLFFGLRYALRSLKGERPRIDIKEIKQGAVKRKNLYSRLRIFEKE